ncbi:WXG100-like domain-containing protein [Streptomyces sp. SAS_260]|uniref:WXG100-like domain-containing protein n=1 Tax=Streptomyces sp. SAS_260 TaxID=3412751 RepID=UPI00403CD222
MAIVVSPKLNWLFFILIGEKFLEANEDRAYDTSQSFDQLHQHVGALKARAKQAVLAVGEGLPKGTADQFIAAINQVLPYLDQFEADLDKMTKNQVNIAMQIREAKWNIIAELIRLFIELAILAVMSFFTGGASASEAAVARARSRVFILEVLLELSRRTHLLPSFLEAAEEAFMTLAVRLAMMVGAPKGQRPKSIDWGDIGLSAAFGAVAGFLAPIFAKTMKNVTNNLNNFKNLGDLGKKIDDINLGGPKGPKPNTTDLNLKNRPKPGPTPGPGAHVPKTTPTITPHVTPTPHGDQSFSDKALDQSGEFIADGASETLAESLVMGAFFGDFTPSWQTFVGSGLSERFEAGAEHAITNSADWLKNFGNPPTISTSVPDTGTRTGDSDVGPNTGSGKAGGTRSGTGNGPHTPVDTDTGNSSDTDTGNPIDADTGTPTKAPPVHVVEPPPHTSVPVAPVVPRVVGSSTPLIPPVVGASAPPIPPTVPTATGGGATPAPPVVTHGGNSNSNDGSVEPPPQTHDVNTPEVEQAPASPPPPDQHPVVEPPPTELPPSTVLPPTVETPTPVTPTVGTTVHPAVTHNGVPEQGSSSNGTGTGTPTPHPVQTPAPAPALAPTRTRTPTMDTGTGTSTGTSTSTGKGKAVASPATDATDPDPGTVTHPAPLVSAAHDAHADAVRSLRHAVDTAEQLRVRVEAGEGTSRDATALHDADDRVRQAQEDLSRTETRLRELGQVPRSHTDAVLDPGSDPSAQPSAIVPVVDRSEAQRHWIASQLTESDLPHDFSAAALPTADVDVDAAALSSTGTALTVEQQTQAVMGSGKLSLLETGLTPLQQAKALMLQPGPWSGHLDTAAATASRRLWDDAFTDFALSTPGSATDTARQSWDTAAALVLPLELHPVLADSRRAIESYRSAVRQVADVLAAGGTRAEATSLADGLRRGLGLPRRLRGGAPKSGESSDVPQPVVTVSSGTPLVATTSTTTDSTTGSTTTITEVPIDGLLKSADDKSTSVPPRGPDDPPEKPRRQRPPRKGAPPNGRTPLLEPIDEDAEAEFTAPPAKKPATPGPTWVVHDLDSRRPPRVDLDLPPAPYSGGGPASFTDGAKLPVYMGGIGELLRGLPRNLLRRSYALGQGDRVLRGADRVVEQLDLSLRQPPGVRPRPARPGGNRAGDGLLDDVRHALVHNPSGFFGDGQQFNYRTVDGKSRVLTVTARPYGQWERFTFGYANPVKIDTMQRNTALTGRVAVNSTATSLAPTAPLGPVKTLFAPWGRVFAQFSWTKRVEYNLQNLVVNQNETRTTDGSHAHLDDVWYEFKVTDPAGRPVDRTGKAIRSAPGTRGQVAFGFAVRDGLFVRIADSLTRPKPPADRLPPRMRLDRGSNYRMMNTESFGPVAHIRDWALQQIGTDTDSMAGKQVSSFFSTDGFHRMSRVMAAGTVTSPPLFKDDSGREPLGVFSVRIEPGEAVLISETTAAELRDISQTTVRNERTTGRSSGVDIGGALGPAFQLLGIDQGKFDLRLLAGLNFRYGASRNRASVTGGTGAVKSAGQAKGDPTGLYLVQKTVTVTAPPDTKAPLPDRRRDDASSTPGKLRKNPPRTWSEAPRTQTFQTWAVERLTRTEARRLAGEASPAPGTPPRVPPYLTQDAPPTLGMSRVEEFTFADGSYVRDIDGEDRTFLDHFSDQVLEEVARAYPDLVAPLSELDPANPRWRGADHFQMAVSNTLEVLNTLAFHSMAGNLETMMTTGLRISLVDSRRATRAHRYVWVDAALTDRRFEGTQKDLRLRFSAPGSENLGGRQNSARGAHIGAEGLLSLRDAATDSAGGPLHAGTGSLGVRWGGRSDSESGYGASATHEAMSIGTKGTHLYSYEVTLTARRGGFRRFRGLLRGVLFLNLLGTRPFVFTEREKNLIGPTGAPAPGPAGPGPAAKGPSVGRVLLGVPVEHTPARDTARPHHPLHGVPLASTTQAARDLALATRGLFERAGRRGREEYRRHPHLTLAVVADPALGRAAEDVLKESSGNSWMLTQQGAPVHDAALRVFQSQFLTANFDQSSAPTGWRASGLWAKAPYLDRSSVLAHRSRLRPGSLTAVTGAIPIEAETTIGGATQASGRHTSTSTLFFGGQLVYLHSHDTGTGTTGNYGLVASPYRLDKSRFRAVSRTALAEINRKDQGRQVLVTADVDHEIAATSTLVGQRATGIRRLPRWLAGASGRRVLVNDGWVGHVPEKSAYRMGLLQDRWGDVPLYTRRRWSPQPWLLDNPFGSFPLTALDTATVLNDFDRQLRPLGLTSSDRDTVHRLMSERVVRALGKEMTGGSTSVPARVGRWGSSTANLWIGSRKVRARAELIPVKVPVGRPAPDGSGFGGLGHSVEFEEHRHAVETTQEGRGRASGASVGTTVAQGAHTGNDTVRMAGPTYAEVGSTQQTAAQNQSEGSVRIATATTTQGHAEYVTRYRMRLTLEVTDTRDPQTGTGASAWVKRAAHRTWRGVSGRRLLRVSSEGDVGELVEHYPLSLMRPDPADPTAERDDPLAPPTLDVPGPSRRVAPPATTGPGGWLDTLHPDDSMKPFTMPPDGFKVRRIVGVDQLHTANSLVLASAYDTSFPLTDTVDDDLIARAQDTPLTRAGTGPAQNLEDGTGNGALSAFYDRTLDPGGYEVAGLTERGFFGGADADLRLYSRPQFRQARLLAVTDGMKHEAPKRHVQGGGATAGRLGQTESSIGGGPATSSSATGTNQMGASGPGDVSTESDTLASAGDRLASVNVKPNTTRTFLFAIPTTWLSVAAVHHHLKDSAPVRAMRSPFGNPQRAPQARETETTVLAWVREDVARELGLIEDDGFPPTAAKAWDAVTKADKEWTAADKKYWELRRDEGPRRETALTDAENLLTTLTARDPETLPQVIAARGELARLEQENDGAEPAHDGWAELHDAERDAARDRVTALLRAADDEVTAARAARDTARGQLDHFTAELGERRAFAEALADEYARVRAAADRLTRWHQLAATPAGRAQLGTTPEPDEVVFRAPPVPVTEKKTTDKDGDKKDGGKKDSGKKDSGGQDEAAGNAEPRPAFSRPPWETEGAPDPSLRRFDAAQDHRILTATDPDGRSWVYDLHEPDGDGNGFFTAILGVADRGGPTAVSESRRTALAGRVARSVDMPPDATLDPQAVFRTAELTSRLGEHFRRDPALSATVEENGGRLPEALLTALTPAQRQSLVRLHVQRARRWDDATANLAADLTARSLGVDLTVVGEDGSYRFFLGSPDPTAGPLRQVTVYRRGDSYLSARPRSATPVPAPPVRGAEPPGDKDAQGPKDTKDFKDTKAADTAKGKGSDGVDGKGAKSDQDTKGKGTEDKGTEGNGAKTKDKPGSDAQGKSGGDKRQQPSVARSVLVEGRQMTVQNVAPDGNCLFTAIIAGLGAQHPGHTVRGRAVDTMTVADLRNDTVDWYRTSAAAHQHATRDPLETIVHDRYPDLRSLRPLLALLGLRTHLPLTPTQQARIQAQLTTEGLTDGTAPEAIARRRALTDQAHGNNVRQLVLRTLHGPATSRSRALWREIRSHLPTVVPATPAQTVTMGERGLVDRAIRSPELWHTPFYDDVPQLLTQSLGIDLVVVQPDGHGGSVLHRLSEDANGPTVYVAYNGIDHYETLLPTAPQPGPRGDLTAGFGDPVMPKRVKDEERDDEGDVRANPLWIPLEEVDPDLLITGKHDAVWLYTVTDDGRVLLGSEAPSEVMAQDQFDALLAGVRARRPDMTAESLRAEIDGLGHTGIAAVFEQGGRTRPGASRVSGEFRWSESLRTWTVNDKSGRYMSKSVRPDVEPVVAAGWLDNVAALFTDRLGVQVTPEQVKSSATKAPEPKPGETENRSAPLPLMLRQPADGGDWLPGALVEALRKRGADSFGRPGLGGLLGGPDPSDALHRWTEFRLAAPDAAARAPRLAAPDWAGPAHTTVSLDDLAAVGVAPTPDQAAFAALTGALPLGDLTLPLAQRYRLLRRWADRDDLLTEIAAGTAVRDLGIVLTLITDDGTVRRFEP